MKIKTRKVKPDSCFGIRTSFSILNKTLKHNNTT